MPEEYEISETGKDDYEVISLTPLRRLERRVEQVEKAGSIPQLQNLITQIIELIRSNQKIVDRVIQSDSELRNELSKLTFKMGDMTSTMKNFISLIESAGKEEVMPGPESVKPLAEQLEKLVEQNQKLIESNQAVLESLDNISRKIRTGTPVSKLLSSGIKLRREMV